MSVESERAFPLQDERKSASGKAVGASCSDASERIRRLDLELDRLERRPSHEVLVGLEERKIAELEFHDRDRDPELAEASPEEAERLHANRKFYSTVAKSQEHLHAWLERHAKGKVFLDYACGNGDMAIAAARYGAARVIGLDISPVSIENCRRRAEAEGLADRVRFVQGDCERTLLPDASVDTILCCGMLHHLDLSYAFPELRRILVPGGRCLAVEALNYNPAIKLYRWLTPAMRTDWEKRHILSMRDVRFAKRFFRVENVRFWHLASILATPLRSTRLFGAALRVANVVDSLALRVWPVSRMAWMFTFELVREMDANAAGRAIGETAGGTARS